METLTVVELVAGALIVGFGAGILVGRKWGQRIVRGAQSLKDTVGKF